MPPAQKELPGPPAPLSALSRSPSGTSLYRSFSSPFSSPRKNLSSPSILRRKQSTPGNKPKHNLTAGALPSLPAVKSVSEKDVASVVMSPRWVCPLASRGEAFFPPNPESSQTEAPMVGKPPKPAGKKRVNSKNYWSGRVFVSFGQAAQTSDEEEPMVVAPIRSATHKRKREVEYSPEEVDEEEEEEDEPGARAQFSSNVSHVLLAMAELRDDEEDAPAVSTPPPAGPEAELVSQLLLEASSVAEKHHSTDHATGAAGSNTTSGGITPSPTLESGAAPTLGAQSDASNDTGLLAAALKLEQDTIDQVGGDQNTLAARLEAPSSPGVAMA